MSFGAVLFSLSLCYVIVFFTSVWFKSITTQFHDLHRSATRNQQKIYSCMYITFNKKIYFIWYHFIAGNSYILIKTISHFFPFWNRFWFSICIAARQPYRTIYCECTYFEPQKKILPLLAFRGVAKALKKVNNKHLNDFTFFLLLGMKCYRVVNYWKFAVYVEINKLSQHHRWMNQVHWIFHRHPSPLIRYAIKQCMNSILNEWVIIMR